jgi:hypothetical protein
MTARIKPATNFSPLNSPILPTTAKWIKSLPRGEAKFLKSLIFITPCSGDQLYQARAILGLDVTMDFGNFPRSKLRKSIVYLVNDDSIVPSLDPYFRALVSG